MTRKKLIRGAGVSKRKRNSARNSGIFFPKAMITKLRVVDHVGVVNKNPLLVISNVYCSML